MSQKIYRIHPAIGICRVGRAQSFFIGPETPGGNGVEINNDQTETPVRLYKDSGQIKKQGARFRVFVFEIGDDGIEAPVGEVPGDQVSWCVRLVNRKAAGNSLLGKDDGNRRVLVPTGRPRNSSIVDRSSLVIDTGEHTIAGIDKPRQVLDQGRFLGTQMTLGEILTDYKGNLIVLGGPGDAIGVPELQEGELPPLTSYSDNDRWCDDVCDGPVSASVTLQDGTIVEAVSAWVISGPPDFAPEAQAPITLYDITVAASISRGWITPPVTPSYVADILPILKRSLSMRWVHDYPHWNEITDDWHLLGNKANNFERGVAYTVITDTSLHDYGIPPYMLELLTKWRDGIFVEDYHPNYAPPNHPRLLDEAALGACIATSFFPGIEAGFIFGEPNNYSEPGRFSHQTVVPGQMTATMALPWQADFNDCRDDWWPSQRPNDVFETAAQIPFSPKEWQKGVGGSGNAPNRLDMVHNYWKLGFIKSDGAGSLTEQERDRTLPPL